MRYFAILVVVATVFLGLSARATEVAGQARVIDGDTIDIGGTRIRLHGIDAPESGQRCRDGAGHAYRCGAVATDMLEYLIGDASVSCAGAEWDRYGRLIAICRQAGRNINAEMVWRGWARAFLRYSQDYAIAEADASAARRGLWAGSFSAPWAFRSAQAQTADGNTPTPVRNGSPMLGCVIKGNISANGRIYHMPGSRYYDRTVIDQIKGERWFCSETEARAAGWRRARN